MSPLTLAPFLCTLAIVISGFREGDPLETVVQKKHKWSSDLHTLLGIAKKGKKWAGKIIEGTVQNTLISLQWF